jgi:hypothetical protein
VSILTEQHKKIFDWLDTLHFTVRPEISVIGDDSVDCDWSFPGTDICVCAVNNSVTWGVRYPQKPHKEWPRGTFDFTQQPICEELNKALRERMPKL